MIDNRRSLIVRTRTGESAASGLGRVGLVCVGTESPEVSEPAGSRYSSCVTEESRLFGEVVLCV